MILSNISNIKYMEERRSQLKSLNILSKLYLKIHQISNICRRGGRIQKAKKYRQNDIVKYIEYYRYLVKYGRNQKAKIYHHLQHQYQYHQLLPPAHFQRRNRIWEVRQYKNLTIGQHFQLDQILGLNRSARFKGDIGFWTS